MRARLPEVPDAIAERVCAAVARLRGEELYKLPGVGETIAWAQALLALGDARPRRDARRRAQGARGHRARARARGAARCVRRRARRRVGRRRRLTGRLTLLAASMRAAGVRVGVGELIGAHRALVAVDPAARAAYFALRASLCSRREDLEVFDAVFGECSRRRPSRPRAAPRSCSRAARAAAHGAAGRGGLGPAEAEADSCRGVERAELLREKDFADYTDAERRRAAPARALPRAADTPEPAHSPRPPRGEPPMGAPDLRRTVRSSLRHAASP